MRFKTIIKKSESFVYVFMKYLNESSQRKIWKRVSTLFVLNSKNKEDRECNGSELIEEVKKKVVNIRILL